MNLTEKQIEEYNESIGKFMNMKTGLTYQLFGENLNLTILDRTRTCCYPHELRFHKDWNWLMEVIEKIEKLPITDNGGVCVSIEHNYCRIYLDDWGQFTDIAIGISKNSKIEATFKAVVNFIEWYNQQK